MRIIDAHVHLYPPEINAAPAAWAAASREPHWARLCTRRRRDGRAVQGFPSADELLHEMDQAGIERSVLLGWYWERPESCAAQNRFHAACVRAHPDRLSAFATVHPVAGHDATLAEVERARDDGLLGLGELSPHSQGHGIDDPVFRATLARAGELGLPINLHVTDPAGRPYPGRIETPLEDFVRLAREFPATTFILAHWGGLLPVHLPEAAAPANVYVDTAASPLLYGPDVWAGLVARGVSRGTETSPLLHGRDLWAGTPKLIPPERILFGSDYPLRLYPNAGDTSGLAEFVTEAKQAGAGEALLALNAARLLGV